MKLLKRSILLVGLALTGSMLAADAPKGAPAKAAASANLHLIMLTKVNPQGLALWDVTNNAGDDNGNVDASKVTVAQWAQLLEIGKALEESGRLLAASKVIAAAPGAKLQDEGNEGASKAADVQRYINAEPAEFRKQSLLLQKSGADVIEAARKRDAKKLTALSGSLDGVCENCHVIFWYPQQKK